MNVPNKREEILIEFDTKSSDPDYGYGEYISLNILSWLLKLQCEKYENSGINPLVRLVGDKVQVYKEI